MFVMEGVDSVCCKSDRCRLFSIVISLSLGDQITTTLATSILLVCSEQNS